MGTHNKPEACAKAAARHDPDACPGCGENPCRELTPWLMYTTTTTSRGVRFKSRTDTRDGSVEVLIHDYQRVRP